MRVLAGLILILTIFLGASILAGPIQDRIIQDNYHRAQIQVLERERAIMDLERDKALQPYIIGAGVALILMAPVFVALFLTIRALRSYEQRDLVYPDDNGLLPVQAHLLGDTAPKVLVVYHQSQAVLTSADSVRLLEHFHNEP